MSAMLAQNWWALALRGVAALLFGFLAFLSPGVTLISLALLFAAYLFVDGVFGIVSAVRAGRRGERWGMLLAEGVLNIGVGLLAAVLPGAAVFAFVLMTAFWSLVTGGLMLASAYKLTGAHGRWWMALAGVASVVFGILLILAPLVGAIVLAWWIGAYAIAFGAFLLALAFKLRSAKSAPPSGGTTATPLPA